MEVLYPFGFQEEDGLHWPVPPGTIVDGASIPQPLWSIIGGPFEGMYRDASVVHDYYCDVRSADWRAVHRVFYRGMLVSGVSMPRAKLLYAAVYFAGPRWNETVVANVRRGPPAIPGYSEVLFSVAVSHTTSAFAGKALWREEMPFQEWLARNPSEPRTTAPLVLKLEDVERLIAQEDPGLRDIETAIDDVLGMLTKPDIPRTIDPGPVTPETT
jgi:hypothetical protein